MRREHGFSLLEVMVAMAVMLSVTAGVFSLMNPAQGSFASQPEISDMQQRLRVGADTLYKDLVMAGNGAYQGSMSGSLLYAFTPVMPFRQGTLNDDPPGTFKDDTITLVYVPPTFAQTSLSARGPNLNSVEIGVNPEPACPNKGALKDPLCGFESGMTVMMYDDSGNFDIFTITNVQDAALHLQHNNDKLTYTDYAVNTTKIVQANYFEYYLNTVTNQLMFYDGTGAPDVPVVDNVVGLKFEYYGDPQPPAIKNQSEPWQTTYGPAPKAAVGVWPKNTNCVFSANPVNPDLAPLPKLDTLGAANSALVQLTPAQLRDGPWCPNDANPNRWDADLLRVRKIGVTLRVQAAAASLRGPASALFTRGGTSTSGTKWVPDQEIHFMVSPRNLNLGR